jgi:hypothetical protein
MSSFCSLEILLLLDLLACHFLPNPPVVFKAIRRAAKPASIDAKSV